MGATRDPGGAPIDSGMTDQHRGQLNTGKDIILSRLRIASPGPGFVQLPDWVDEEYPAQLTAEKAIRRYLKGRGTVREWVKLRERNEALDLEVYALAAL
jgi:phage terminase large subunit GpA-like protein